ncbi:MAG: hypothetical protein WC592_05315 [Candidatus Omnitrophota bacterium]
MNKNTKRDEMRVTVHDEIARTYFKLSEKESGKKRPPSRAPWIVAAAAIILAAVVLVSKSRIDVKIRIVGEVPSVRSAVGDGGEDVGMLLAKGAEANGNLVKNISFMGDAKHFSRVTKEQIVLCNTRGHGWAGYAIELKEPIDLGSFDLTFTARGDKGGEYLSVSIVDSENRSYMIEKESLARLTKDWKRYKIEFAAVKNAIDLAAIVLIRFEFGSLTAGNSPSATIYLKDIYATKIKK